MKMEKSFLEYLSHNPDSLKDKIFSIDNYNILFHCNCLEIWHRKSKEIVCQFNFFYDNIEIKYVGTKISNQIIIIDKHQIEIRLGKYLFIFDKGRLYYEVFLSSFVFPKDLTSVQES